MSRLYTKQDRQDFVHKYRHDLVAILNKVQEAEDDLDPGRLNAILRQHPKDGEGYFKKSHLIAAYRELAGKNGLKPFNRQFIDRIKMKPVRTISGVTPVTVLTKPFPCPGKCIFCPNDVRMPKSYIASEPGAQRAEKNHFDPYLQTYNRLHALRSIGHSIGKAELIVLGGTWSFYPQNYQVWFVKRMFEALNDFGDGIDNRANSSPSVDVTHIPSADHGLMDESGKRRTYNEAISKLYIDQELKKKKGNAENAAWEELFKEHKRNETNAVRCVGLVLETRPDYISQTEVITLRKLGCTKTQIGLQSLQDNVLELNKRGHDVAASRRALRLLRQAGLKIHAHWMPNLYGSNPQKDINDYIKLFSDPDFKPDELKIYPCSLIDDTELVDNYESGKWRPYTYEELRHVLVETLRRTPEYCRLTRVIRDIPSDEIVTGNKLTNFRQIAQDYAVEQGIELSDIRFREVKDQSINPDNVFLKTLCYRTSTAIEYFLQYVTTENKIAGFLRLSLPTTDPYIDELESAAIIREVHVYGQAISVGKNKEGVPQHLGLGTKLITQAQLISKKEEYKRIAVISAIGTREYYQKLGFKRKDLYQLKDL